MTLIAEKIAQTAGILDEFDLDCWLLFVRETRLHGDPVMPLLVGENVTWQSFFAFTRTGDAIAMVGNFDADIFRRMNGYTEVIPYTEAVGDSIRNLLARLNPRRIGLNFSIDNPAADGLTFGMYQLLCQYLEGSPFADRLCSAEDVCAALRSRKTPEEIALATEAAVQTERLWHEIVPQLVVGMSEKEIGRLIDDRIAAMGALNSFATTVNAADKSSAGHAGPTDAALARGDLLHIDFGIEWQGYCSDLQRLLYVCRPRESVPPPELIDAFETVSGIITETALLCVPGALGCDIDAVARERLRERGYPEYEHALGHQLGRSVHDGGAIIGPKWERYGRTPTMPLAENNLFTLELEILLSGIGCVGLEEDICVTPRGGHFLCPRQLELEIL
jgi:Xaa-Pro aminopeptidase